MSERHSQGRIEVAPAAVATIANHAVLNAYGVVGMSSKNLVNGLAQVLRPDSRGGVQVHIDEDQIIVDLYVVLEYGVPIAAVARNIMSGVRFSVEKAVGVPITGVNVHVQGLHMSGEAKKDRRVGHPFKRAQVDRSRQGVQDGRGSAGGKTLER
jgi:uncharacterized alkaline shock family protein YloU